jgi:hypothetical protein
MVDDSRQLLRAGIRTEPDAEPNLHDLMLRKLGERPCAQLHDGPK